MFCHRNRAHRPIIFLLCILLMSGCAPTLTELWLEKNGRGKIEVTFEINEMLQSLMLASQNSVTDTSGASVASLAATAMENIDTQFTLHDLLPDSLRQELKDQALLRKMQMALQMNAEEGIGRWKSTIEFDSPDDLVRLREVFNQMAGDDSPYDKLQWESMIVLFVHNPRKRIVTFPQVDPLDFFRSDPELADMIPSIDTLVNAKQWSFQKMMAEDLLKGEITTRVHMPGRIKAVSDPNAVIEGRTATVTTSLKEVISSDARELPDLEIKYQRRR